MIKISKYFIPYVILLLLIGFKGSLVISFILVLIHEAVHFITCIFLGYSGFDIEITPIGTVLHLDDLNYDTPYEDILISISAPVFNILLAFVFYKLYLIYGYVDFKELYLGNAWLGLFNLLPALPLDGGRILRDFLSLNNIYKKADRITVYISFFISVLLMLFFMFSYYENNMNLGIAIAAIFIFYTAWKEKERIVYLIMADIINKRYKFQKKGHIENRYISIYYKMDLLSAMGLIDKNKFCIFSVLEDNMKFVDMVYEDELIEGIKKYGNIPLIDFINARENDS